MKYLHLDSWQEETQQTDREGQLCPGALSWPAGRGGRKENASQAIIPYGQHVPPHAGHFVSTGQLVQWLAASPAVLSDYTSNTAPSGPHIRKLWTIKHHSCEVSVSVYTNCEISTLDVYNNDQTPAPIRNLGLNHPQFNDECFPQNCVIELFTQCSCLIITKAQMLKIL